MMDWDKYYAPIISKIDKTKVEQFLGFKIKEIKDARVCHHYSRGLWIIVENSQPKYALLFRNKTLSMGEEFSKKMCYKDIVKEEHAPVE